MKKWDRNKKGFKKPNKVLIVHVTVFYKEANALERGWKRVDGEEGGGERALTYLNR